MQQGGTAAGNIEFLWQTSLNDVDWNDAGVTTAAWDPADALVQDTYYRRVTRRMDGLVELMSSRECFFTDRGKQCYCWSN
jgi:hypothetical protein